MDSRDAGVTIIEMLVVMAIIGMAMAIAVPAMRNMNKSRGARIPALELASELKAARVSAILVGRPIAVHFILPERRYIREGAQDAGGFFSSNLAVSFVRKQAAQVEDGGASSVIFFPDGSSTGGAIVLAEGRIAFQVSVDWLTGNITTEPRSSS